MGLPHLSLSPVPKSGPEKEGGSQAGLFVQVYFRVSGTELTDVCPSQGGQDTEGQLSPFHTCPLLHHKFLGSLKDLPVHSAAKGMVARGRGSQDDAKSVASFLLG